MQTQTHTPESALVTEKDIAERVETLLGQENQVFENIRNGSKGIDQLELSIGGLIVATRSKWGTPPAARTHEGEPVPGLLAIEHLYGPDSGEAYLSGLSGSYILRLVQEQDNESWQGLFVPITETESPAHSRTGYTTYYLAKARLLTAVDLSEAGDLLDRFEAARNTRLAAA